MPNKPDGGQGAADNGPEETCLEMLQEQLSRVGIVVKPAPGWREPAFDRNLTTLGPDGARIMERVVTKRF